MISQPSITNTSLKINFLKFHSNLPGSKVKLHCDCNSPLKMHLKVDSACCGYCVTESGNYITLHVSDVVYVTSSSIHSYSQKSYFRWFVLLEQWKLISKFSLYQIYFIGFILFSLLTPKPIGKGERQCRAGIYVCASGHVCTCGLFWSESDKETVRHVINGYLKNSFVSVIAKIEFNLARPSGKLN